MDLCVRTKIVRGQMNTQGKYATQTGTFSKAYLERAWDQRADLTDIERKGFAQFFYISLCGHIEAVICAVIKARLSSMEIFQFNPVNDQTFTLDGVSQVCSFEPVSNSIWHLSNQISAEAETAALGKLLEVYNKVFPKKLSDTVGPELHKDINALVALRNIFGHGRSISIEIELKDGEVHNATLDGSVLKMPAQRLHEAGVINLPSPSNYAHIHLIDLMYCDDALMHFYNAIVAIETKLKSEVEFLPEKRKIFVTSLPTLSP
jgi:hypothetical protein